MGGKVAESTRGDSFKLPIVQKFDNWWTVGVSDVQYGDKTIRNSTIDYAILDTGTSLIYIAESEYKEFERQLMEASPDFFCNGLVCYSTVERCDHYHDKLANLTIVLEGTRFTITP